MISRFRSDSMKEIIIEAEKWVANIARIASEQKDEENRQHAIERAELLKKLIELAKRDEER